MGKGVFGILKAVGRELGYGALGLGTVTKNFSVGTYNAAKKLIGHITTKIPKSEAEGLSEFIFGRRGKRGHLGEKDGILKKILDFKPLNTKGTGVIGHILGSPINLTYKAVTNLPVGILNHVILSPGGRIAAGMVGAGFMYGMFKGSRNANTQNLEAENMAGMTSQQLSPLVENDKALENIDVGYSNHGAEGNIVFALHKLRQG